MGNALFVRKEVRVYYEYHVPKNISSFLGNRQPRKVNPSNTRALACHATARWLAS
jgi:hypothetical protein